MHEIIKLLPPENQTDITEMIDRFMRHATQARIDTFRALNRAAGPGGIVFAGDSITEGFPIHELFPQGLQLYNRGIGGINSIQLLDNLDAHILNLRPSKVFLLIGTNDIQMGETPEAIADRIVRICAHIREMDTKTMVCVLSVYPTNSTKALYRHAVGDRDNATICRLNACIREKLLSVPEIGYIDLHAALRDADGNLAEAYTTDGLHISVEGYQRIVRLLLPYMGVGER